MACFVSIHKKEGDLRACIGTVEPTKDCLLYEIISNVIAAANTDPRFGPIALTELETLEISVDVLSTPKLINDLNELNPNKFGIIVTDGSHRRGGTACT